MGKQHMSRQDKDRIMHQWMRVQHLPGQTAHGFAKRVGVPWGTFSRWMAEYGELSETDFLATRIEELENTDTSPEVLERELANLVIKQALVLTKELYLETDAKAKSDLSNAVAKLVDKYLLLTGGATKRTETTMSTSPFEAQLDKLLEKEFDSE